MREVKNDFVANDFKKIIERDSLIPSMLIFFLGTYLKVCEAICVNLKMASNNSSEVFETYDYEEVLEEELTNNKTNANDL